KHVPPGALRVTPRIELRAMAQAGGVVPVPGNSDEVVDPLPEGYDLPAQLVTHDHGILHTGERVWCAACGYRTVVVFVQVAAADPVVPNAQLELARPGLRLRHRRESQVLPPVVKRCAHRRPQPSGARPPASIIL